MRSCSRGGRRACTSKDAGNFQAGNAKPNEPLDACLARELREELAVGATVGGELMTVAHDYPDRRVELHFLSCDLVGEPSPQQGQEMRWVPRAGLADSGVSAGRRGVDSHVDEADAAGEAGQAGLKSCATASDDCAQV